MAQADVKPGDPLDGRERHILLLVADGMTNRQIGTHIRGDNGRALAEDTIAGYVRRTCIKLRAANRTHAAVLGLVMGVIQLPREAGPELDLDYLYAAIEDGAEAP